MEDESNMANAVDAIEDASREYDNLTGEEQEKEEFVVLDEDGEEVHLSDN